MAAMILGSHVGPLIRDERVVQPARGAGSLCGGRKGVATGESHQIETPHQGEPDGARRRGRDGGLAHGAPPATSSVTLKSERVSVLQHMVLLGSS
jgi:hypothetical protein